MGGFRDCMAKCLDPASPKAAVALGTGEDGIWDGERDSDERRVECGCSES
jgi:hypothetical protein